VPARGHSTSALNDPLGCIADADPRPHAGSHLLDNARGHILCMTFPAPLTRSEDKHPHIFYIASSTCSKSHRINLSPTLQHECWQLEQQQLTTGHDVALSKRLLELATNRTAAYSKLLKLEEEVLLHRCLLEEEEQIMYVDGIDELAALYDRIEEVRAAQGCRLTPWVRFWPHHLC
jgi:hypothetical protein